MVETFKRRVVLPSAVLLKLIECKVQEWHARGATRTVPVRGIDSNSMEVLQTAFCSSEGCTSSTCYPAECLTVFGLFNIACAP